MKSVAKGASTEAKPISSPAATGGAGTVFEQAVDAYFLSLLLVGGIPPVLIDCTVFEVSFQNEFRGWRTDDALIVGQTSSGQVRKLACRIKRRFTVSSIDSDFKTSILDFWADLQDSALFSPDADQFAFVVQLGTNTLLREFGSLLDCARASQNSQDFEKRLATEGLISTKAVQYCDEVATILAEALGRTLGRADVFPLLRVLHILSLDLATSTRLTEGTAKSLLAFAVKADNKQETSAATWNELVVIAGKSSSEARTFRRDELPSEMVAKFATCGFEHPMIQALRDHSSFVFRGIRSTIGPTFQLQRRGLVQQVLGALETSRIVLISGAAGNGKSSVAKQVLDSLRESYFVFAFRSEEFAQPHFDNTLSAANIGGRATELNAVLAGQSRKLLLVESLERLLEKSTRDAFADLLSLVHDDPTYRLVLTCRDYSADLARAAFFGQFSGDYTTVRVPPLTTEELDEVQAQDDILSVPLASPQLRKVLSNPYVLDKARSIQWATLGASLPSSEREFRDLFWREIVRVDHKMGSGLPNRRDVAFIEIALRRARSLSPYANASGLDNEALDALIADSLVVRSNDRPELVAPSHDVLEDWAILRWLNRTYTDVGENLLLFQGSLGTEPALRRSYRRWLAELLEQNLSAGGTFFRTALSGNNLSSSFVDDTLVALLQSSSGGSLLILHESSLLDNNKKFLKRVIHLVRMACVATPPWASGRVGTFTVPTGNVWASLLAIVQRAWAKFDSDEEALLALGLVDDWLKGVTAEEPYPAGGEAAASIAYALLESFDDYSHEEELGQLLRIIAKLPKFQQERYEAILLSKRQAGRDRSRVAEKLQEIVFSGPYYESLPTARDSSAALIQALRSHLVCTDADLQEELSWPSSIEIEIYFGLRRRSSQHYFPESAYRTPMLPLLQQHPRAAMQFLIELFNHSADWYAHPRITMPLEPALPVTIKFADGSTKTHWANSRLWQLYRSTSVGPYVLQCYLMALERWLRQIATQQGVMLDDILVSLLKRTENAAIAGVVAAVATAFPFQCGETLLCLLSSREYIALDRGRMVQDLSPPSEVLSGFLAGRDAEQKWLRKERAEADKWSSRKSDLENAIRNLQMTAFGKRVEQRLDELREALPAVEEQDEDDKLWRLAMHRMDLRDYQPAAAEEQVEAQIKPGQILFKAQEPDEDIKEMIAQSAPQMERQQEQMGLLMWAYKAFKQEHADAEASQWRPRLVLARKLPRREGGDPMEQFSMGGPELMAAVCVRLYWDELSADEKTWCLESVIASVMATANDWHHMSRVQRYDMAPDRSCAYSSLLLTTKTLTKSQRERVNEAVVCALTHPIDEVRWHAVQAAAELCSLGSDLSFRAIGAIAQNANEMERLQARERKKAYDRRRSYDLVARDAAELVRKSFWQPSTQRDKAFDALNVDEWHGADAQNMILTILSKAPDHVLTLKAYERGSKQLVKIWATRYDRDERHQRNTDAEFNLSHLIERFVHKAGLSVATQVLQPLLAAINEQSSKMNSIILGILSAEDQAPNTVQFWALWKLFAERAIATPWAKHLTDRHSGGAEMVDALFLGTMWKESTTHWKPLEGHAHHIHNLFETLPASECVTDSYLRFLYHVGEQSLPQAFILLLRKLSSSEPNLLLRSGNSRYRLEILLQRYVYAKPLLLKQCVELREAVLGLLEVLILLGSSAAFKMRDDFVTPVTS
jgi:hypothetical protein